MGLEGILDLPDFPDAKCIGSGDIFFPEGTKKELHEQLSGLKFICNTCPYSQGNNPCLQFAMSVPDNVGFWGGQLLGNYEAKNKPLVSETKLKAIVKCTKYGLSQRAIADKLNIDQVTIRQVLTLARERGLL